MPKYKIRSSTIAASNEVWRKIFSRAKTKNAKTVKAFVLVLTSIHWGYVEDYEFTAKSKFNIKVKIDLIAEVLGYKKHSKFTSEVRRIYRLMNNELFESYEDEPYFFCDGFSKNKEYALFKIVKPEAFYNLSEKGDFTCLIAEDIFRCENLNDFRVLYYVASAKITHHRNKWATKELSLNTFFIKQCLFMMPCFKYCFINKKHPYYSDYLIKYYEAIQWDYYFGLITKTEKDNALKELALNCFGYFGTIDEINKAINEIVHFKRSEVEAIFEHALKIINEGKMFRIIKDSKTGKLYTKKRKQGYRIESYKVKVVQIRTI